MALCGIGLNSTFEGVELRYLSTNSSTRLVKPAITTPTIRPLDLLHKRCFKTACKASRIAVSPMESEENMQTGPSVMDGEIGPVTRFRMSEFAVSDRVSIGLSGRADEVVFEAIVKNSNSALYNTRVVLRELTSAQARRRGNRAIEVLRKLAHRRLLYHSYSMQVHGYVSLPTTGNGGSFTLVHGYHGSFSLRHWLQQSDWLPTLESTLALDEESVRRVGDDKVGGPAVSRQLRLIRILMRDLLIGVNYLHSHGLAHTELRLENVHISPVDRHIKEFGISLPLHCGVHVLNPNTSSIRDGSATSSKVGQLHAHHYLCLIANLNVTRSSRLMLLRLAYSLLRTRALVDTGKACFPSFIQGILGNAADFSENSASRNTSESNTVRRQMMIAFDMRCVGFMMAKMVMRELMDPLIFTKFKSFLMKGNDPSCLREFMLPILVANSPTGNSGLQILDRNWGAGWNLLSLLLATKSSNRVSCLEALRHPFLCGPRWRVEPSMNIIRWGIGSTAVRITEEYIYGHHQRRRLAHFIELIEMLNPNSNPKNWLELLPGRWRLLYSTGRHIGLTLRQPANRVLIGDVHLTITRTSNQKNAFTFTSNISYNVMIGREWPHDKAGTSGNLRMTSLVRLRAGKRLYLKEEESSGTFSYTRPSALSSIVQKLSASSWRKAVPFTEIPPSLPVAKLVSGDVNVEMSLDEPLGGDVNAAGLVLREVRLQVPPEIFDVSKIVCGTYVDSRLLVLRSVNGSALLFTLSCAEDQ